MSLNPTLEPVCIGCDKSPEELDCYKVMVEGTDQTATEYVLQEEGTLNPINGHFLCDSCYIKAGMPSSPTGWKAP